MNSSMLELVLFESSKLIHLFCFREGRITMRGPSLSAILALVVIVLLAMQLDLTAAAAPNHYLVLHPCLFPTHMRVVFSVTKELVKVRGT